MTAIGSRKIDVYTLGATVTGALDLRMGDDALSAAGPAVAIQKFLVLLLTRKGSDPVDGDRGTEFLPKLTTGQLRSDMTVSMAFSDAAADAISQLSGRRVATDPLDEDVEKVDVQRVVVQADSVTVEATVTLMSGEQADFILPVKLSLG